MSAAPAPTWSDEITTPSHARGERLQVVIDTNALRHFREAIQPLLEHLTETGRATFLQELEAGLADPDPDAAVFVLESWYRSMVIRHSPSYSDIPDRVGKGRLYSQDELKAELGL